MPRTKQIKATRYAHETVEIGLSIFSSRTRSRSQVSSMNILSRLVVTSLLSCLIALGLAGCDLINADSGYGDLDDVPTERLVAMTAIYGEENDNGRPFTRIVLTDFENPSNYKALSKSGTYADRPCFGPDKQRLIYEDHEVESSGSGGRVVLLNLRNGERRPLTLSTESGDIPLVGSLKGYTWMTDGSEFFLTVSSGADLTLHSYKYDLETGTAEVFAQRPNAYTTTAYGKKGRDSVLVLSASGNDRNTVHIPFYFVDVETGTYIRHLDNKHLRFVPEVENRGGWKKAAFNPDINDENELIVFENARRDGSIGVTTYDESYYKQYRPPAGISVSFPRWAKSGNVLLSSEAFGEWQDMRVIILRTNSGEFQEFIPPHTIDGAIGLRTPDY